VAWPVEALRRLGVDEVGGGGGGGGDGGGAALVALAQRCLRVEQADRPTSAEAVIEALRAARPACVSEAPEMASGRAVTVDGVV